MEIPENGFYYHYKHDDAKDFNNYSYEVTGIGLHSENKDVFVIYRPLYEIEDLAQPISFVRPIELFTDEVKYHDTIVPHFTKITDPELIAKLEEIKKEMYLLS
ncbi:MAG TPA: DUF1653 domain-containing protein [Candidatus Paceibacterota bacterium]|jgi:hypothetical protein|nr:DUF1653 domain-containing protein [Candidatus Paceibacterota bacterium]